MDCHSLADGKIRSVFMQIVLGTASLKKKGYIFVKFGSKPYVGRKALSWVDTVFIANWWADTANPGLGVRGLWLCLWA